LWGDLYLIDDFLSYYINHPDQTQISLSVKFCYSQ